MQAYTALVMGIAYIVIFAKVGVIVGQDYDGVSAPAINNFKETNQD